MRPVVHMVLHLLVPYLAARLVFPDRWQRAWIIMVATMIIDVDHLLADPIYDPNRCGIGFHPLHTQWAVLGYITIAVIPATRVIGFGLLIHIALDALDCAWMRFF